MTNMISYQGLVRTFPNSLKGKLLLHDAGYVGLEYMAETVLHGGHFLMRSTKQLNPTITRALNAKGREVKSLTGQKLKALPGRRGNRAPVLDLDVSWSHFACRMVLLVVVDQPAT